MSECLIEAVSHPSYGVRRGQRLVCNVVDPPQAFCWQPNHREPAQVEHHSQSPPGAELFSPSCQGKNRLCVSSDLAQLNQFKCSWTVPVHSQVLCGVTLKVFLQL